MKIAIYSRAEIAHEAGELSRLIRALKDNGIYYYINRDFAAVITGKTGEPVDSDRLYADGGDLPDDADLMISYGGDGTFLDTVRLLNNRPVPVLGINSGRLGFLANVSKAEVDRAVQEIASGCYTVEERTLLFVDGDFGQQVGYPYAFNEFSIQKSGVTMVSVDVFIDGEQVSTYLGDGLILSTPAGSTAYSLSVGGPIVAPSCHCFVMAPIASHNLTMRPLVVPDTSEMRFRAHSRSGSCVVTLDNREYVVPSGSEFCVKKAKKSAFLAKLQNISFYHTLRDKMMWGMDTREFSK